MHSGAILRGRRVALKADRQGGPPRWAELDRPSEALSPNSPGALGGRRPECGRPHSVRANRSGGRPEAMRRGHSHLSDAEQDRLRAERRPAVSVFVSEPGGAVQRPPTDTHPRGAEADPVEAENPGPVPSPSIADDRPN